MEFLKALNNEWVIEWDFKLSYDGKYMSCQVLIPKVYDKFKHNEKKLKNEELVELNEEKIKKAAKSIIKERSNEIKQQFFDLYIDSIKQKHKVIQTIVSDLGDGISDDLAVDVALYINMKPKKVSLPEFSDYYLNFLRDKKVKDLVDNTHTLVNTHKQNMENIRTHFRKTLRDIEGQKKPKQGFAGKVFKWIKTTLSYDEKEENKEVEITDEQWDKYKETLRDRARRTKDIDIKDQQIRTIRNWCNVFIDHLNEYKHKVYKANQCGSIIHLKTEKDRIKKAIQDKYRRLNTNLRQQLWTDFKSFQQKKKHLKSATLSNLVYIEKNSWKPAHYDLRYVVPKVIPPTYDMMYTYIDLPNIETEMKTNELKDMHYEIQQDHDLLFHYVMANDDVIMFIRGDNEEMKTSETKIIVSNRQSLDPGQSLKTLRKKRVLKVAFCESQKIFAILFEGEVAFAVLMENTRVAFTNKGCILSNMAWFNNDIELKAMLIQEVVESNVKNIFVWFVDQRNYVRVFDLDTNDWDTAKEFDLDQKYDSYILSPDGSFLIGFKPQYEEDEAITAGNETGIEEIKSNVENVENIEETKVEEIEEETKTAVPLLSKRTPTGRVQLHAFLLSEKRKLLYKIHSKSRTGYESGNEPQMTDDNRDELDSVDNVLLPEPFGLNKIQLNRLCIKSISKSDILLLCCMTSDNRLLFHPLHIQVSDQKLRIHKQKRQTAVRKITKLDYMEYMIEKFGSRSAVSHPQDGKLSLHTTYIITDECKDGDELCGQIAEKICKSLYDKEKKDFQHLLWKHNVLNMKDERCPNTVLRAITNKKAVLKGDEFIKRLIIQIPIQIARAVQNAFQLMYNGEDNQKEYRKEGLIDSYSLCKTIRFGAYDGLIKSWEGKIKVVSTMGKQTVGKSYMMNHLLGSKFDVSGGRCTDGAWLSAQIVSDTLYILCDFEGLGSFERTPQEDMLLATFNSAISNCTIFKCENHFDRSIEEMFNNFQSGVKIMSGSKNCFSGELLLVIKDIVPTAAEAAVEDFEGHIERLAQESPLIKNDEGQTVSMFFGYRMYKSGLSIIPYPPLANEEFFVNLNTVIQPAIDDINVIHIGGKQFLDHLKLVMSKLNIGDWAAMSDEHAKIRIEELRANLQNAVEAGAIFQPKSIEFGVTFKVDDDQNLLLLDGNKVIRMEVKESLQKIKHYQDIIKEYTAFDEDIEEQLLKIASSLDDAGLILGKSDSLKFLHEQFCIKIKRTHDNFEAWTNIFQCFLDIIYWRRAHRVNKYIKDNTQKFKKLAKDDINALIQQSEISLNVIRDTMKICKSKCNKCFYLCLLCKNHEDDNDWDDEHACYQVKHSCTELCEYCRKDGKSVNCGDKCGHNGRHNCRVKPHTCGKKCSLSDFGGCQEKCNEESGHGEEIPCKCNAETHYCKAVCSVPICKITCKYPYNAKDHQHLCIQTSCPYKCQVKCWDERLKAISDCGRDCSCNNHAHHLETDVKVNKNEVHICDKEHPCPHRCNENGLCSVDIKRRIIEKKVFTTSPGSNIEYDACAEVNAEKKRCCKRIPPGKFRHDGIFHRCYSGHQKDNIHTCDEKCDLCGYYCQEKFGHYKESGSFHDCVHGNMRNTIFYATEDIVDIGDNRKYKVGDSGIAEICNIFCERLGRGHIHLELCPYEEGKCVEIEGSGKRHEQKKYKPYSNKPKDEVKHSRFWRRKKWKDPCLEKRRQVFDKCNFVCQHPSHNEYEEQKKEEDESKYCIDNLWHKDCNTQTKHKFKCTHAFGNAHVIFVCDISGSMYSMDGGNSKAEYTFIHNSGNLNNRLGALYSAIYKFLNIRLEKGCRDKVSAIMTPGHPRAVAANRVIANEHFVRDYLLQFKPTGCENYGQAFRDANTLVNQSEETVIIFLCDGISSDNGAAAVARNLKSSMNNKFSLFCFTLGPGAYNNNETVKGICSAGKGKMVSVLSGNELGTTFSTIAKQMNKGTLHAGK